jgi:hypothetical protein
LDHVFERIEIRHKRFFPQFPPLDHLRQTSSSLVERNVRRIEHASVAVFSQQRSGTLPQHCAHKDVRVKDQHH